MIHTRVSISPKLWRKVRADAALRGIPVCDWLAEAVLRYFPGHTENDDHPAPQPDPPRKER